MRRLLRNSIFHFFSWLVIGLSAIPLQAQYDVSTATFTFQGGNPLRIDTQETMPEGIAFSTDGFKMFIVGAEDAEVNQYNLVTAFDITTAAFETNYSVIAQETDPKDITFSTDGQTMFVLGVENVHQYALNIPFDITTGTSLTTSFSIAAQENQANGVRFSSDGLKMFITGFQRRAVLQYDLSGTFDLTGLTSFTALFSSSGQLNSPHGITFSGDGLKMFLHDGSNSELDEFSLSAAFSLTSTISFITSVSITAGTRDFVFSDDGSRLFVTSQGFSIAPEVSAYDLSAAFDISSSLSLTNQVGNPFPATHAQGLEFSPDGLHMFTSGDIAEQYDLSLPYDLSTATSSGNSISLPSPSIITSRPVRRPGRAIRFSNDGLKMFTVAWGGSSVVFGTAYVDPIISQHSLLLPYDLSTAALDLTLSLSGTPENALEGLAFSSDGLKMFVIGEQLNQVDQYRLFTAFDITGGVTYEASFSVSAQESESSGIEFSDDGIFMFITGSDGQDINQYKLTTPFDISSGVTFTTSFSVATEESSPRDIDFSDDGLKMFIIGDDIEEINQYDLSPNANINLVSPPSPAFGLVDVGTSATLTYTIENTGLGTLNITNIISDNSPPLSIQNAPTSIAAGASATFEVVFVPTVAGFESASITINSNAFNSPVLSFSVSGTSGQEATALDFDGSNDHVTLPNGITNAITGNTITLEAWVNLDAIRGSDVNSGVGIINEVSNSRVRYAIYMGGSQSGQQRIYAGFFDGSWRVASTTIPLNEWKHIASSYDGSVIRIYIDGAEVASTIVNRSLPSNGPDQWRIGRRWDGVANSSRVMAGQIDEVRIWNDVRTCAEILTYKDTELTGNESDLVAYYNFNQGLVNVDNAGITTLPDLGPNGFNGTLSNFTLNGTTSNWVDGFSNGVLPNNTSPQPEIEVVPLTGTNFGTLNLGQSATLSFQITNSGSGTLTISDITSSITPTFTIQNAPSGVAAGATATFEVLFSATPAGEYLANITIESNDCDEPSFTFSVSGTAEQDATALDFDGSDDSVILPSAINNQITGNTITVEAWANVTQIKGSSTTSGVGIITEGANGSVKYSIFLSGSQGEDQRITAGFFNGTWRTATSSIPLDEWKHLASSYDGTTIRLYIDGVEMATTSYTTSSLPTNNPDVWIVGRRWDGAATSANVMRGQIDEIRIWNDVRTCSEILTYKDAELTGTEDDLVAYYNFNQGLVNQDNSSETTLTDLSPNNFNGTLQRFTLAGTTSNWADGTANGVMTGGESLQPEIEVVPLTGTNFGTLDFGQSATLSFQITNSGSGTLNISSITSSNTSSFTIQNAPSSLAVGATATFEVVFLADPAGVNLADITIESDDCDEVTLTLSVSGTSRQEATALDLDGANDWVQIPNTINNSLSGNEITVEAWVNIGTIKSTPTIVTNQYSGSTLRYAIYLDGNSGGEQRIEAGFYRNGAWRSVNANIPLNTWTHLASTYDGTTVRLYVNGIEVASNVISLSLPTSTLPWRIGRRWDQGVASQYMMDGQVDEVRIWNTARTCSEILTYKDAELTGSEADLVAYYNFNQGLVNQDNTGITTLTDGTSNNLDATLQSFTLTGLASNWVDGSGNGVTAGGEDFQPEVEFMPVTTSFGLVEVGQMPTLSFQVTNSGSGTLDLSGFVSSNPSVFTIQNAPASVAASSSATFEVVFTPVSLGEENATISFTTNDCDEPTLSFSVSGTGALPPEIDFTATQTDVGFVPTGGNGQITYTIQNLGGSPLEVSSITSSNPLFTVNPTSLSINGGSGLPFTVTFSPTALGSASATITILSNDTDEGMLTFVVTGESCQGSSTPIWQQLGLDIDGEAAIDASGSAVSFSSDGTRVAIGSPRNRDGALFAGQVRTYEYLNGVWQQLGSDIEGEESSDQLGTAVSLSADGNRLAIGVPKRHTCIYEYVSGDWQQLGLNIDEESAGDNSGTSVSLSGDGSRVAIGAPLNDGNGSSSGHVRIYQWSGSAWQKLGSDIDGESAGDLSGYAVSLSSDGSRVAIGAPYNGNDGAFIEAAGHVRVYEYSVGDWQQLGNDISELTNAGLGGAVSLSSDGNRLAIGASINVGTATYGGYARIYEYLSGSWMQVGSDIVGKSGDPWFGFAVSFSSDGSRVAVGSPENDPSGSTGGNGYTRVYDYLSGSWTQVGTDFDGEAVGDQSGYAVALSADGSRLAIGAPTNDGTSSNAGHVRIHEFGVALVPSLTLSGTGTADFGAVAVGVSSTLSYTIENSGCATLTVTSISSTAAAFTVTPSNVTVPALGSATFTVTFAPQVVGTQSSTISVVSNDENSPTEFVVSGTGAGQAEITASVTETCAGDQITLSATSGDAYLWSTGEATQAIVISPTTTTTYSVTVTMAGVDLAASQDIFVNSLPTLTISGTTTVCTGDQTILTVSGATSYLWSNSSTNSSITVGAGQYNVTGVDGNGCVSVSVTAMVTEITPPTVTISGTTTVCAGDQTILTASGATSYFWNNGSTNTSITVGTGQYSVTGVDGNGCVSVSATTMVTENTVLPEISISLNALQADEDSGRNFVYTFTRTDVSCLPELSVSFSVSGTALYNDDYFLVQGSNDFNASTRRGTVTIPAVQTSVSLIFQVQQDAIFEPNETIIVTIEP